MRSGLRTPIEAIPTPDLAVPYDAPKQVNTMAAVQPMAPKNGYVHDVSDTNRLQNRAAKMVDILDTTATPTKFQRRRVDDRDDDLYPVACRMIGRTAYTGLRRVMLAINDHIRAPGILIPNVCITTTKVTGAT
jgi:hypothetical protein